MAGDVWYDPDLLAAVVDADKSHSKPVGPPSRGEGNGGSGDHSPASLASVLLQRVDSLDARLSAIESLLANLSKSSFRPDFTPLESRLSSVESQLHSLVKSFNALHDAVKKLSSMTDSDYESYLTVLEGHMKNILGRLEALEQKCVESQRSGSSSKSSSVPAVASTSSRSKSRSRKTTSVKVISDVSEGTDLGSGDDNSGTGGLYL